MTRLYWQEKYRLLGWGDLGVIFEISDAIVLKCPTTKDDQRFENENRIFDRLERHPPCPHIVYSFIRLPNLNFMQHLPGGNLETRLRTRQRRDPSTEQVLEVFGTEAEPLILRWMKELTSAAAWLESLELAHGDLRPPNILLDAQDHLKLADFDNTRAVGTEVDVGTAPYARVLGDEAGELQGTFGFLGPRTEQFHTMTLRPHYIPFEFTRPGQVQYCTATATARKCLVMNSCKMARAETGNGNGSGCTHRGLSMRHRARCTRNMT